MRTTPEQRTGRLNSSLFKSVSFGHLPAAIDWLWIQCLLDPDMKHVEPGKHPKVYYDLDFLTDLDPLDYDSYHVGANVLAVIHNDGPGALNLLLKGHRVMKEIVPNYPSIVRDQYWSVSWGIPMLLAYVNLFELNDLPHAADAFVEAAKIPGSPPYLTKLKDKLEKPGGQYDVGLHLVEFMLVGAKTDSAKEELQKQHDSLIVGKYLFETNLEYQKTKHFPPQDPWGGSLSLDPSGRIVSSTPHQRVFGLD